MKQLKQKCASPAFASFLSSVLTILAGLVFGFLLLLVLNAPAAARGIQALLTNGVSNLNSFAKVLRDSLQEVDGIQYTTMMLENMDLNALKDSTSQMREHQPDLVFVAANITEGKGNLICVVGDNAKKRGLKAGNIVREVAQLTGGKGGGRPDQAMAGVGDVTKVDEALLKLKDVIVSQLG